MSTSQILLAAIAAVFLLLHMTGTTGMFVGFFDLELTARELPYLLALPAAAVFTMYILKV